MQGLIGREWVRFNDVVAILSNFDQEEFLSYAPGPYLLEIPTEEVSAAEAEPGTAEVSALYKRGSQEGKESKESTSGARRGNAETQQIARPNLDDATRTFSIEDLLKRKRKKAEARILFLGGHARSTFGRGRECDVRVYGKAVSRVHAAFLGGGDARWHVVDLGSRNGTMVNNRRLTPQMPVNIHDEPVVQLGDWRCAVMFPPRLWDLSEQLRKSL